MKLLTNTVAMLMIAALGTYFGQGLGSAAAAAKKTIVLDKIKAKKAAVTLMHAQHIKIAKSCTKCHHKPKIKACSDAQCHGTTTKGKSSVSLKDAFHKKCITCHKAAVKKDAKSKAPKACGGCHK